MELSVSMPLPKEKAKESSQHMNLLTIDVVATVGPLARDECSPWVDRKLSIASAIARIGSHTNADENVALDVFTVVEPGGVEGFVKGRGRCRVRVLS